MTELRAAAERAIAAWRKHAHPSEAVDVAMAGLAAALAAEQPQAVEVMYVQNGLLRWSKIPQGYTGYLYAWTRQERES
ncbi:MAG: hypothetical protein O9345_16220 [Burkholderiaceae bacterium]|nr:hypothetical protein [Burkholderiales bacterium]MCZ8339672.1 hypothetical protein [Burkholderiaceae bacterium]